MTNLRGVGKKKRDGVFEGAGVDTPMHTMLLAEDLPLPPPSQGKIPKNSQVSLLPLNRSIHVVTQ